MPTLSAYLGHAHVNDTFWYLSATPELLHAGTQYLDADREEKHRHNADLHDSPEKHHGGQQEGKGDACEGEPEASEYGLPNDHEHDAKRDTADGLAGEIHRPLPMCAGEPSAEPAQVSHRDLSPSEQYRRNHDREQELPRHRSKASELSQQPGPCDQRCARLPREEQHVQVTGFVARHALIGEEAMVVDRVPLELFFDRGGSLSVVSPAVFADAGRGARRRSLALLRRS